MHKIDKIRSLAKLLSIPLIFAAVYLTLLLISKLFQIPSDRNLVVVLGDYFKQYGLWLVFVGAFIEGFLFLGQYFPGGTIIFLGVVSTGKNMLAAAEVVLIVAVAFFIAYTLNYLIGKYGWYNLLIKFGLKTALDNAKEKLHKHGLSAVIFSYWEPNLASITATAAGIIKIPPHNFLFHSLVGIAIWETFWGIMVFTLGNEMLWLMGLKYVSIIFFAWISIILIKNYFFNKTKTASAANG